MITKKAEYAIIILAELASKPTGTVLTSKQISNSRGIPVNLVVQLLTTLKEAGWTVGTRGPTGGTTLVVDPAQVNIKDVIEKVDGPIGITRCLFSATPCRERTHCTLRGVWHRAQHSMISVLEGVTIKQLAEASENDCQAGV